MTAETGTYRWMAPEVLTHMHHDQIIYLVLEICLIPNYGLIKQLYSTVTLRQGEKKHYNHKVDAYSFAIVLWELIHNKLPFEGMSNLQAAYAAAFKVWFFIFNCSWFQELDSWFGNLLILDPNPLDSWFSNQWDWLYNQTLLNRIVYLFVYIFRLEREAECRWFTGGISNDSNILLERRSKRPTKLHRDYSTSLTLPLHDLSTGACSSLNETCFLIRKHRAATRIAGNLLTDGC